MVKNKFLYTLPAIFIALLACFSATALAFGEEPTHWEEISLFDFKRSLNPDYSRALAINNDFFCIKKDDGTVDYDCSTKDRREYHAWVMVKGMDAYNTKATTIHESFRENTYFFEQGRFSRGVSTSPSQQNKSINYTMLYLHRITPGIELLESTRTHRFYEQPADFLSGTLATSADAIEKARYALVENVGSFVSTGQMFVYNTVPHVLGTEGMSPGYAAVMEETTGTPIPVWLSGGNTGLFDIKNDTVLPKAALEQKYFPNRNWDNVLSTSELSGDNTYNPFVFYDHNTAAHSIDTRPGLLAAIDAMGGPQYVGSVQMALSEALTQRNSAYNLMSALPNNGRYIFNTMAGNTFSGSSENSYGVIEGLLPRNVFLYLFGEINPLVSGNPFSSIFTLNQNSSTGNAAVLAGGEGRVNANFKFNGISVLRHGRPENDIKLYNYQNIVTPVDITTPTGNTYTALQPSLTGKDTIYYGQPQDENNIWGVWRQNGHSVDYAITGGYFPYDTIRYPDPGQVVLDWSENDPGSTYKNSGRLLVRYPWKDEGRTFSQSGLYSKRFLNAYLYKNITGRLPDESWGFDMYDTMVQTFLDKIRTHPDILYRVFYFIDDIENNNLKLGEDCDIEEEADVVAGDYYNMTDRNFRADRYDSVGFCYPGLDSVPRTGLPGGIDADRSTRIAKAFCETLTSDAAGCTLSYDSFYETIYNPATSEHKNAWSAIYSVLTIKDGTTTYMEDLAYIYYNYFDLISFPSEVSPGQVFSVRRPPGEPLSTNTFYSYSTILPPDKSNTKILNEETRLGNNLVGTLNDEGTRAIGTKAESLFVSLGVRRGTEIYKLDLTTGTVDSTGDGCPAGYEPTALGCARTVSARVNTSCPNGYKFDWNTFNCVRNDIMQPDCAQGYTFEQGACVKKVQDNIVCPDGYELDFLAKYSLLKTKAFAQTDLEAGYKIDPLTGQTVAQEGYMVYTGEIRAKQGHEITVTSTRAMDYDSQEGNGPSLSIFMYTEDGIVIGYHVISHSDSKSIILPTDGYIRFSLERPFDMVGATDTVFYFENNSIDKLSTPVCTREEQIVCPDGFERIEDETGAVVCRSMDSFSCPDGFEAINHNGHWACKGKLSYLDAYPSSAAEFLCEDDNSVVSEFAVSDYIEFDGSNYHAIKEKTFVVPYTGYYYLELWGSSIIGNKGGYVAGMFELEQGTILHTKLSPQNDVLRSGIFADTVSVLEYDENYNKNYEVMLASSRDLELSDAFNDEGLFLLNYSPQEEYRVKRSNNQFMKRPTDTPTTTVGQQGHNGATIVRITFVEDNFSSGISYQPEVSYTNLLLDPGVEYTYSLTAGAWLTVHARGATGGAPHAQDNLNYRTYAVGVLAQDVLLDFYVGAAGGIGGFDDRERTLLQGGYLGGGDVYSWNVLHHLFAGSGGGQSYVAMRQGMDVSDPFNRVLVAGGQGGGGGYYFPHMETYNFVAGGYNQGSVGAPGSNIHVGHQGGGGGTQTAGGQKGADVVGANDGELVFGGAHLGGDELQPLAGAGGGGYFGGGSGGYSQTSGGGGSSFVDEDIFSVTYGYFSSASLPGFETTREDGSIYLIIHTDVGYFFSFPQQNPLGVCVVFRDDPPEAQPYFQAEDLYPVQDRIKDRKEAYAIIQGSGEGYIQIDGTCPGDGTMYDNACFYTANFDCPSGYTATVNNGQNYCTKATEPLCDTGYTFDQATGACILEDAHYFRPEGICANGFELNETEGRCEKTTYYDPAELDFELSNDILIGNVYKIRNYIAYNPSYTRGKDQIISQTNLARSYTFPSIVNTFYFIADDVPTTYDCRQDPFACDVPVASVYEFSISRDIAVNESSVPAVGEPPQGHVEDVHKHLWSMFTPDNSMFMSSASFMELYSVVDSYIMFKPDVYCYTPTLSFNDDGSVDTSDAKFPCYPYPDKPDTVFQDDRINFGKDEFGNQNISAIGIGSSLDYFDTLAGASVHNVFEATDNNIVIDDDASVIVGFGPDPKTDIYIDTVKIFSTDDTLNPVYEFFAATKNRCSNGVEASRTNQGMYTSAYSGPAHSCNIAPVEIYLSPEQNYYAEVGLAYVNAVEGLSGPSIPTISIEVTQRSKETSLLDILVDPGHINDARSSTITFANYSFSGTTTSGVNLPLIDPGTSITGSPLTGIVTSKNDNIASLMKTTTQNIKTHTRPGPNTTVSSPLGALAINPNLPNIEGDGRGYISFSVSNKMSNYNAYPTWDTFDVYYKTDYVDISSGPFLRCFYGSGAHKDFLGETDRENPEPVHGDFVSCHVMNKTVYEDCSGPCPAISKNVVYEAAQEAGQMPVDLGPSFIVSGDGELLQKGDWFEIELMEVNYSMNNNIAAYSGHYPEHNANYPDINLENNSSTRYWVLSPINYIVSDLEVSPGMVYQDFVGGSHVPSKEVVFDIEYDVTRQFDIQTQRDVELAYELRSASNSGYTVSCQDVPGSALPEMISFDTTSSTQRVSGSISCVINFTQHHSGHDLVLSVEANPGRVFQETTFEDNIASERVRTSPVAGTSFNSCLEVDCARRNDWAINFDFVYTYTRDIVAYDTGSWVNTAWEDKYVHDGENGYTHEYYTYTIQGAGNTDRWLPDYIAFKDSSAGTQPLCTDYRNNNTECWRYEQNVYHNIEHYLRSQAVTKTYPTHKTLVSNPGCVESVRWDYGVYNQGSFGYSHNYSNASGSSGASSACHGFTQSPNTAACDSVLDWWGKEICIEHTRQYSSTTSGSLPSDYIPATNFSDKIIGDGYPMSPTTKTSGVNIKGQQSQGADNEAWVIDRQMNVCTQKAPKTISYYCPTGYKYGTEEHNTAGNNQGDFVCNDGNKFIDNMTCQWVNTASAPSETKYYPDPRASVCFQKYNRYSCSNITIDGTSIEPENEYTQNFCTYTTNLQGVHNLTYTTIIKSGTTAQHGGHLVVNDPINECIQVSGDFYNCTYVQAGAIKACKSGWAGTSVTTNTEMAYSSFLALAGPQCTQNTFMTRQVACYSGDLTEGQNCYRTSDENINISSEERCIAWDQEEYQEIKYYTTGTPTSIITTREYSELKPIRQYRTSTQTASIGYPDPGVQKKEYQETFSVEVYIKSGSTNNQWRLMTDIIGDMDVYRGDEFELKVKTVYETNRGEKPDTMPYITGFYNNYHVIPNPTGMLPSNSGIYPRLDLDSVAKWDIGDGVRLIRTEKGDLLSDINYGWRDVMPAQPYGCKVINERYHLPDGHVTANTTNQGHSFPNTGWKSYYEENADGVCYFGPDKADVWKKTVFGNDFNARVIIKTKNNPDIFRGLVEESGSCTSWVNGVCARYERTLVPEAIVRAGKGSTRAFYIDANVSRDGFSLAIDHDVFDGICKYEQELLQSNTLNSDVSKKFFEEQGSLLPLCHCPEFVISTATGQVQWGSSHWIVR